MKYNLKKIEMGTVAILGSGISGLSAAYRLTQIHPAPRRIVLLEVGSRLGGWISSRGNEDGVIYEHGPSTIRPVGLWASQELAH